MFILVYGLYIPYFCDMLRITALLFIFIVCRPLADTRTSPADTGTSRTGDALPITKADPGLSLIYRFEGFVDSAHWDVNAYRNGYGTPCKPRSKITPEEAKERARYFYDKHFTYLRAKYSKFTDSQISVLCSVRYNLGSFGPGLKAALLSGDSHRVADQLKKYVHSRGEVLPGLVKRRKVEADLFLKFN